RRVLRRHALTDGPRAVRGIEHGDRVRRVGPRERCRRNFHWKWRCVGARPRRAYAAEGLERSAEPLVLVCEPRAERRMKLLRNVECDATERRDTGRRETRMLNGKVEFVVRAGEKLAVLAEEESARQQVHAWMGRRFQPRLEGRLRGVLVEGVER